MFSHLRMQHRATANQEVTARAVRELANKAYHGGPSIR